MLIGSKSMVGLPVISIKEGEELGKVRMLIPNPDRPEILAIAIEDREWFRGVKIVPFDKIFGIGESAITVENKADVSKIDEYPEIEEILAKQINLLDSKILTQKGRFLGEIKEFYIKEDGSIVSYEVYTKEDDKKFLPSEKVLTVGKDIIIAREDALDDLSSSPLGNVSRKLENVNSKKVSEKEISKETKNINTPTATTQEEKDLLIATAKKEVDLKKIFQERQRKYLMGKKVIKDILSKDGTILVPKDTVIDKEILDKVQKEGKFLELSMSVDISK